MAQIIDGYTGTPNIFADDMREYNRSLYGEGDYVLQIGECLGYNLVSNNEIQIKDGMFLTQGARGLIKKGTTESCVIENGAQDANRNDLIVMEYAKDETTQIESHTLKVIKGTAGAEAVDPEITTGDIINGTTLHQMPLYRVKLEGLNIVAVEQLFEFGSVAAETVDPMETTEPGFAADAYLTGKAISEQNKNLNELETDLGNLGSNPVFKTQTITIGSLSVKGGTSGLSYSEYEITPSIPTGYTLIGCVGIMPDAAIFCGLI